MVWNELQKEPVGKFHDGRQVIAEKSDHMIPFHPPEVIVQTVQELVHANDTKRSHIDE